MIELNEIVEAEEARKNSGNEHASKISNGHSFSKLTNRLRVELITDDKEFEAIAVEWTRLVEKPEVKATVFQTYEWQHGWWSFFSKGKKPHIITIWDSKKLVGIIPFFEENISLFGLYQFKRLKLIGGEISGAGGQFSRYSPSDYLDIIIDSDYKNQVRELLCSYILRGQAYFDEIELSELSDQGVFINDILPALEAANLTVVKTKGEMCPGISLPNSLDAYMDDLDGKVRYQLRYSKRAVTEKELFSVKNVSDENELDSAFNHFINLHQKRWNMQGYPGIFHNQKFEDFLKITAGKFLKKGILKFTLAFDNNEKCIAVDFAFTFKDKVYDYQKAFDIESDLAKYSPGKSLFYFMLEDAINKDMNYLDLMRGDERYKMKVTNEYSQNWKISIPSFSRLNGLKYKFFQLHQRLNNLFNRIALEFVLIQVHQHQFGKLKFIPNYMSFIKERLSEKLG